MQTVKVRLNLFPFRVTTKEVNVYRISGTHPRTQNKEVKFRLAALVAKELSKKTKLPVFSVGEQIYCHKKLEDKQFMIEIEIEGTTIPFKVELSEDPEMKNILELPEGPLRLTNSLVDWYFANRIPNSFKVRSSNYIGKNIFEEFQKWLYKKFKVSVNEGLLRASRIYSSRMYLLLDVDFRVVWEKSLWDEVKSFVQNKLNQNAYLPDESTLRAINEKFGRTPNKRGVIVEGKNRTGLYEVLEFDYTKNPTTPGTAGNGMSQEEYFVKVYGSAFRIKDKKQPLVRVRVLRGRYYGTEIYHVPEFLVFHKMPRWLLEDENLMKALVNIQKIDPRGRYARIIDFIQGDPFGKIEGFANNNFVKEFIEIDQEPLRVDAKLLPAIKVKMGNEVFTVKSDAEFLKNIFNREFHRVPEPVQSLGLIVYKERTKDVLDNFYPSLVTTAESHGLKLPNEPKITTIENESFKDYIDAISRVKDTDIVLTFTHYGDRDIYESVKNELLLKYGVLSQNITYEKTVDVIQKYQRRKNKTGIDAILTLLSMQLCAKLGGAPWAFDEPIYDEATPIIGLEVDYTSDNKPISACAIFDPYGEYLFSEVQMGKLNAVLTKSLERYANAFGVPTGIFLIRDGLNRTQEERFLLSKGGELELINEVLEDFNISNYVLVMEKKGTMLRMFKEITPTKVENPAPGTVVIGTPFEENEMLLVSQETDQGTVNPVLYKVVMPENPTMERIAYSIYKLCRHHWNTNRATRIPAPALHADRIAYLVKNVLRGIPTKRRILDKPFYL